MILFPLEVPVFSAIWRTKIPRKVKFFTWQVLLGCVNTLDRLVKKMRSLVTPSCCILCQKVEENLDHNTIFFGVVSESCLGFFLPNVWSDDHLA